MGDPSHDPVAEALDALNEDDQHDHDGPHDFRHEALVAVADAEVAETAAAHGAGHGGVADQADDRDRQARDDAGHGFGKQDLRDDLHIRGTHRLGGLDEALVHFAQARLDDSGDEGRHRECQRNDGGGCADRGADDESGERNDRHEQDDERHRAESVDHRAENGVEARHRKEGLAVRHEEQDAEGNAREGADAAGDGDHDDRLQEGVPDHLNEIT